MPGRGAATGRAGCSLKERPSVTSRPRCPPPRAQPTVPVPPADFPSFRPAAWVRYPLPAQASVAPALQPPPDAGTGVRGQHVLGPRATVERCDGPARPVRPPRADPDVCAHGARGWGELTACGTCGHKVAAPAPPPRTRAERASPLQRLPTPGAEPSLYPGRRENKLELSRRGAGRRGAGPELQSRRVSPLGVCERAKFGLSSGGKEFPGVLGRLGYFRAIRPRPWGEKVAWGTWCPEGAPELVH